MNEEVEMLQYIYQNAGMGKSTIEDTLNKMDDLELKSVLLEHLQKYEEIVNKSQEMILERGTSAKDLEMMPKIMTYFGIMMNTLKDNTSSHIAEMMIQGSTMGITDITKNLNRYVDIDIEIRKLADKLLKIEEQNIEDLKPYL